MHASASDTWRSDTEWAAARGYSVDGLARGHAAGAVRASVF